MKIGIDISQIVYQTGVSVYTENLVEGLSKIDEDNEYKLFAGSLRRRRDIQKFLKRLNNKNFRAVVYPLPPTFLDFLWNKLHVFEIDNLIGEVDIFHSSDWTQPPSRSKKVTTIHDLTPILYPKWSLPKIIDTQKRRLSWVKNDVDCIIVPTEFTKKDLVQLGFSSRSAIVIPEAPEAIFKPSSKRDVDKIKKKFNIKDRFILSVGVSPRKNINNTVKAFMKIKKTEKNLQLLIVGHKYIDINVSEGVIFTGHVEKDDLPHLYSAAETFLYPSLYEGFGLPILESMSCGTPVVTSNRSSMKEVAANAAVLVDPENVNDIVAGLISCMKNKNKWSELGSKRVIKFSWGKTANLTLETYQKTVSE